MILVADGSSGVDDENELKEEEEEDEDGFTLHRLDPMTILAMMAS